MPKRAVVQIAALSVFFMFSGLTSRTTQAQAWLNVTSPNDPNGLNPIMSGSPMSTIASVNPPKGTTVAAIQVTIYMLKNNQPTLQLFSQVYGPPGGTLFTASFNAPTLLTNSTIPCAIFQRPAIGLETSGKPRTP